MYMYGFISIWCKIWVHLISGRCYTTFWKNVSYIELIILNSKIKLVGDKIKINSGMKKLACRRQ